SPAGLNELVTLNLGSPTMPSETAGQSYSTALTATGGSGHYSYAISKGALPAGLSLSPTGLVSGSANLAGSYSFTVVATDTAQAGVFGSQTFSLTVTPGSTATLTLAVPSTATAGTAFKATLTALDAYQNKASGTVTLTSSDGQAISPKTVTLTGGTASPM